MVGLKFGDFEYSLALGAAAVAASLLLRAGGGVSAPFALFLLFSPVAFYAALSELKSSGMAFPRAEYLLLLSIILPASAASLSQGAIQLLLPLFFVPLIFCAPALASLARGFFTSG